MVGTVLILVGFIAVGIWRFLVGLNRLGYLKRHIPDWDSNRFIPRFMRADEKVEDILSVVGGILFVLVGIVGLVAIVRGAEVQTTWFGR